LLSLANRRKDPGPVVQPPSLALKEELEHNLMAQAELIDMGRHVLIDALPDPAGFHKHHCSDYQVE
jgi:hypothetical protein